MSYHHLAMCAGIKIQHCRIGSKRSEIVGLNRSGLSALGNVHWELPVDGKQSLSRDDHHWVSHLLSPSFDLVLNESIFCIFNIFTATRPTSKELQRLIICVTHSLSHLPQIAGVFNEPGVPPWWICYRVVLLFMCALCETRTEFWQMTNMEYL